MADAFYFVLHARSMVKAAWTPQNITKQAIQRRRKPYALRLLIYTCGLAPERGGGNGSARVSSMAERIVQGAGRET